MKNKKGQLIGMPFIYIFAIIVAALILAWGLRQVLQIGERADEVQIADFLKSLESNMAAYYMMETGSETTIPLKLPKKVAYLCALDGEGITSNCKIKKLANSYTECTNDIVMDIFDLSIGNFYIFPEEVYKRTSFLIWKKNKAKIKLKCGNDYCSPLCYKNGQKIRLTAMGDHIELS